jgi:hypothetical protein
MYHKKNCERKVTPVGNITSFETAVTLPRFYSKMLCGRNAAVGLNSRFSILPAKVTVKDGNSRDC